MSITTGFDFQGFRRFGAIAAIFESGREPGQSDWDSLFSNPGYAVLTASEFPRDVFSDRIRLAYSPTLAAERAAALAANKSALLAHFVDARGRWSQLEAVVERIAGSQIGDNAVRIACELLPVERLSARPGGLPESPPVSFLIFLNDARGYEPVVFDVVCAADLSERDLTLLLAHEFHHNYRNHLLAFQWDAAPQEYADLLWTLDQIHAEGVADLINVPEMMYGNGSWAAGAGAADYRAGVEAAPQYLSRLDAGLQEIEQIVRSGISSPDPSSEADRIAAIGAELKSSLPRSGHPIGYFMASAVANSGLRHELTATIDDPFAFFGLYQRVAKQSSLKTFSPESLAALASLRESCLHLG